MRKNNRSALVSVIMTAFNTERYIAMAIKSIVNQTYKNLEIIIVDDSSTDSTWKIINDFQKKDNRIKIYRLKKNSGPSTVSNFALKKAKGTYIARLDSDDIAYANRINKQVEYMEQNHNLVMISGQCKVIDEQNNIIGEKKFPLSHKDIYNLLFTINPIQHPGCMYRRKIFQKAKIRYEKKYFISHDLKILFELLEYGKFANLPDYIIKYRYRPNSITHKNPKRTFKETLAIRYWAWKKGIYIPTKTGICTHFMESILVALLPNRYINSLFQFWRISKIKEGAIMVKKKLNLAFKYGLNSLLSFLYLLLFRMHK